MTRLFVVQDESGLFELLGKQHVDADQPYAWSKWKAIWRLDLNDLERTKPDEPHEDRLQRVERCMLVLTAEWLQLTGRAEPPLPITPKVLSPAEWSALFEARIWAASLGTPTAPPTGTEEVPLTSFERGALISAIEKLTDIAAKAGSLPKELR